MTCFTSSIRTICCLTGRWRACSDWGWRLRHRRLASTTHSRTRARALPRPGTCTRQRSSCRLVHSREPFPMTLLHAAGCACTSVTGHCFATCHTAGSATSCSSDQAWRRLLLVLLLDTTLAATSRQAPSLGEAVFLCPSIPPPLSPAAQPLPSPLPHWKRTCNRALTLAFPQMRHPYTDYDYGLIAEMSNSHFLLRSLNTSTELKGQMVATQALVGGERR